eukprot:NODE_8798_length_500_cov_31.212860_g7730_i0.p1 GENE.NODE_8798_length_500_cov_31.212860_g7730_i0~~NODE_8798_length_500_cov_31.212860_g7730_i0.p1  ORF type:complete len:127 (+),score=4.01 NODE_8798_length_500_cov_31.212860_g7730_i0:68-448(+)
MHRQVHARRPPAAGPVVERAWRALGSSSVEGPASATPGCAGPAASGRRAWGGRGPAGPWGRPSQTGPFQALSESPYPRAFQAGVDWKAPAGLLEGSSRPAGGLQQRPGAGLPTALAGRLEGLQTRV